MVGGGSESPMYDRNDCDFFGSYVGDMVSDGKRYLYVSDTFYDRIYQYDRYSQRCSILIGSLIQHQSTVQNTAGSGKQPRIYVVLCLTFRM